MEASQVIPVRETERMMKLQDVILKAMAKKLTAFGKQLGKEAKSAEKAKA